jgi:glutathione S-transferase
MVVYGSKISYFTGKFETYLRYKRIPYSFRALDAFHYVWVVPRRLGATQFPSVQLEDGRWMSDTTPMIAWLEGRHPEPSVMPAEAVQRYVALLIEDYADEWLWRPAMHYRWSYAPDRALAGRQLAKEIVRVPAPLALRRANVTRRQQRLFVRGDGVDARTREHAERSYARLLELLQVVFERRPFMFGERPTIADIGLMGPFWRHFGHDPTPAAIMQETAPAVFEWAARMWNAGGADLGQRGLPAGIPPDLEPLLREIGETHLQALAANADAHRRALATHELDVQGTTYRRVPTSAYRVWCLEQLRKRYEELAQPHADPVRELLQANGCWEPLWRVQTLASGHDPAGEAPFCSVTRMVRD